jgi:hypothetical protein
MPGTGQDRRRSRIAAALAAGALALAGGLILARAAGLPEWRPGPLLDQPSLARQLGSVAARCGLRLVGERPRFEIVETSPRRRLRQQIPIAIAMPKAAIAFRADQEATTAPARAPGLTRRLRVWFDLYGRPEALEWTPSGPLEEWGLIRRSTATTDVIPGTLAAALLRPGEELGKPATLSLFGLPFLAYPIVGSTPPQHVTAVRVGLSDQASRNPGDLERVMSRRVRTDPLPGARDHALLQGTLLVMAGCFLVLAIRRRLSMANGAWLAALAGLAVLPAALRQPSLPGAAVAAATVAVQSLLLAVLWSAAESLWRAGDPRFDASLDLLRRRRLTHRAGSALLTGTGLGAAAAGLGLAAYALATRLPGATAQALTVDLPVTDGAAGPLATAITLAAAVAFALALGRRLARRRWLPAAVAAIAVAVAMAPVRLQPWPLQLAASLLVAGALVAAAELGGLTGLLAAGLAYRLLPAAAFTALHLSWLPGSFVLAAGAALLLPAAGAVALLRPRRAENDEEDAAPPPAFILRLERERRLEVEMELLARMQRGLLPSRPPAVPGWEIAARSLLADRAGGDLYDFMSDRAGRLWIAAGDVAGHGFSCAIAQAMVKAALASLLGEGRTPGDTLAEIDRVLRTAAAGRSFTSLALLRLDPATGEALLANAGHPYALLAASGAPVVEVDLPGLPLGQGPPRHYADVPLALAPGTTLALCSDGLFEAGAAGREGGEPYGYERPRRRLAELAGRPAEEVLDGLLEDWRRHRGPGAPVDDTTIVVLRRCPAAPLADPEPPADSGAP